jgi:hypothetical protein
VSPSPEIGRRVIKFSIVTIVLMVLYQYWLILPVLQHLSLGQWRLFAIAVAIVVGGLATLSRLPITVLACGAMAGLLAGGTWAAWQAPNDVPVSVIATFLSHLRGFWREIIVLTGSVVVGGYGTRFV